MFFKVALTPSKIGIRYFSHYLRPTTLSPETKRMIKNIEDSILTAREWSAVQVIENYMKQLPIETHPTAISLHNLNVHPKYTEISCAILSLWRLRFGVCIPKPIDDQKEGEALSHKAARMNNLVLLEDLVFGWHIGFRCDSMIPIDLESDDGVTVLDILLEKEAPDIPFIIKIITNCDSVTDKQRRKFDALKREYDYPCETSTENRVLFRR